MMIKCLMKTNFMDSIFNSLKELKEERSCLAQKLSEKQSQRHILEKDFEKQTIAVAQKKIDELILSSSRMKEEIDSLKEAKTIMEDTCDREKSSILECTDEFKFILAEIAQILFQARDLYKETALLNKISEIESISKETKLKVEQDDKEMQELTLNINNLSIQGTARSHDEDVRALINFTIRAIEFDKTENASYLLQLERELTEAHDIMQKY